MIAHVFPPNAPLTGDIEPPSSKNFTTRYTLASCLAGGRSIVRRPAVQDDAVALVRCCRDMGAHITALDVAGREVEFTVANAGAVDRLEIVGFGARPKLLRRDKALNPGNAGAVFRMLLAVSALLPDVSWETDHHDSLGKRPNEHLLDGLRQLGVEVTARTTDGFLPIRLQGGLDRIKAHIKTEKERLGKTVDEPYVLTISGEVSSQYTSALLFLAPLLDESLEIHVTGRLKSLPLIDSTRQVLSMAGVGVESSAEKHVHVVRRGQAYAPRVWETNGDWPGASALLAATAVVRGSSIRLTRLFQDEQGEKECVPFYERMGCTMVSDVVPGVGEKLIFSAPENGSLTAAAVNGDLCTDAVLAMMGAALFAEGTSRFVQIRNLQFKECDRVREPLAELRKVFLTRADKPSEAAAEKALTYTPEDDPDIIYVTGSPDGFEGGIDVDGRGDHRVIMLLSIAALRCKNGLRILGSQHVSKSFPGWFDTLKKMGVRVEFIPENDGEAPTGTPHLR